MPIETQWNDWPLVAVHARDESPHDTREAIIAMLRVAVQSEQAFSAVVDMSQLRPEEPARGDVRVAEQARAVKELRPALARNCRGLAFVVPPAVPGGTEARNASERFWGCPVATVHDAEVATDWVRERLALQQEGSL
ncbi:hypothetical protein [Streptomyces sp. 769]|uniref:hypothetical protein n=1 Tax=Streptomyces sp. 769 TaxID=1262452 RepID=UPI000581FF5D|nr:hypothetical protein [Streptomyces sp. 769]AJC62138.1 hypothetical protein GZL_p00208 [Streptomyces sp. 769]